MKKIVLLITAIIFISQFAKADALSDMQHLVNYKRMNTKHKNKYLAQRKAQLNSWSTYKIPKNFHIPVQLQSYRDNNSTLCYRIYNYAYKTGVGYIPSNLVRYYEEETWFAFQKYGKDAPSLSVILAQQFTESAFNPYAIGDNNKSYGLPQLHKATAQYLYKIDKKTWKDIFYFDRYGKHHFKDIRAMIKFPFIFLLKIKKYSLENKFQGIRNYNGSGEDAIFYAEKVMKRSLFYEELFAKYNNIPIDTSNFKKNLFGLINLSLEMKGQTKLPNETLSYTFENMLVSFNSGYLNKTYLNSFKANLLENKPLKINQKQHLKIPFNNKDYYLIVEDGNTLYSYFKDTKQLIKTLNHSKNKKFYLYYKSRKGINKITNIAEIGKKQVFTNVLPGNKIYIPPGIIIYKPNTNFAVMMK